VRRTEDPLAELARLIGQEDPFADFVAHRPADGRSGGHAGAQRRPQTRDTRQHDSRLPDRRRTATTSRTPDGHDEDVHEINLDGRPQADARNAYSYGTGRTQRAGDIPAVPTRNLREDRAPVARPLPRTAPPAQHDESDDDHGYEPQPRSPRDTRDTRAARRETVEDDGYGEYAAENYDPEYDDDAYLPAHGDEFYDEAPRRRLKGWMLVGVAAIAAIVVGTSGLFAYRALFGPDTVAAPAKVISPDSSPTKMVPKVSQTADAKRVQDRVGGEPPRNNERIVSREESPIDQSRIPQGGTADRIPSGTVTAAAPQFSPAPAQSAPTQAAPAPAMAPANLSTEPRRVRTVTVRADGSVVSNQPPAAPTAAARSGPSSVAATPLSLQNGQAPVLPPQRPSTTTSSTPLRGDNPWSSGGPSGQLSAPATQAALPPQPQPAPTVAIQSAAAAGSYVVQVAAQKSEGEAQQTWQALQQKYGSVLAGQQATIRRVDLGERGVFYRAQVGPFTTRAQASEVCQSLKAAGGECVIQRN